MLSLCGPPSSRVVMKYHIYAPPSHSSLASKCHYQHSFRADQSTLLFKKHISCNHTIYIYFRCTHIYQLLRVCTSSSSCIKRYQWAILLYSQSRFKKMILGKPWPVWCYLDADMNTWLWRAEYHNYHGNCLSLSLLKPWRYGFRCLTWLARLVNATKWLQYARINPFTKWWWWWSWTTPTCLVSSWLKT